MQNKDNLQTIEATEKLLKNSLGLELNFLYTKSFNHSNKHSSKFNSALLFFFYYYLKNHSYFTDQN